MKRSIRDARYTGLPEEVSRKIIGTGRRIGQVSIRPDQKLKKTGLSWDAGQGDVHRQDRGVRKPQ